MTAIVITSLPRTGTTSICRMLEILGFKTYHAPLSKIRQLMGAGRAFADTPCFAPSIMNWTKTQTITPVKHIYLDRTFDSWFDSMTKSTNLLKTNYSFQTTPDEHLNANQLNDKKYYNEVFGDANPVLSDFREIVKERFYTHREIALAWEPFVYKFSDGWGPLCEYLNLNTPEGADIPHLHKNSIGRRGL